jgi:hypothetical protein
VFAATEIFVKPQTKKASRIDEPISAYNWLIVEWIRPFEEMTKNVK